MDLSDFSFSPPILNIPDISSSVRELSNNIENNKRELIEKVAETTGRELAKALKTYPELFDEVISALSSLCGNTIYNSETLEDPMNDFIRDILGHGLPVRDQTRQGLSGKSRSATKGKPGEIDIQIRNNGRPIAIYEGLRLSSVVKSEIYEHIYKATIKYNPQGVKEVFVVAYIIKHKNDFGEFWKRFAVCVREYTTEDPQGQIIWDEDEEETELSAIRSLHGIFNLDDVAHHVHIIAVKIME